MQLLNSISKKAQRADSRFLELDGSEIDVIIFPSNKWPRMGLVLGNEALILDFKTSMSFRVRSGNLGFSADIYPAKCKNPINKSFLEKYFLENHDNPYGIQNIMNLIHRGRDVTTATQFPPLGLPKLTGKERRQAIEQIVKLGKKGDLVFSSHSRHHCGRSSLGRWFPDGNNRVEQRQLAFRHAGWPGTRPTSPSTALCP
ncbi:MAG TPA: hypothetical protein VFC17_02155 [Candidatus Limnocylindrales bacterium]|nr:hypothetical protein [Candidatus Limnocylindrales bacterium]